VGADAASQGAACQHYLVAPHHTVQLHFCHSHKFTLTHAPTHVPPSTHSPLTHANKAGVYVAPRVLIEVMRYLENALEPAATWKLLKPLVPELVSDILFPMMCFTEQDHELWTEDPAECVVLPLFACFNSLPFLICTHSPARTLCLVLPVLVCTHPQARMQREAASSA
jgi:hypothetical protein